MGYDFTEKTAIVTGSARGIGRGIAERLGEYGASLVLADVLEDELKETTTVLREDGYAVEAVTCDVTSESDVESLAERARERFGSIDVLVNNAGISFHGSITDIDLETWQEVIDVNLTGAFLCTRAVVPSMMDQEDGRIVNISSMAGRNISYHAAANYTASKWGLIGLTKHTAWDLSDYNVRANAVCPGATLTPLTKGHTIPEEREKTRQRIALGRWSRPEDQAEAVAFLASDRASFITGTVLEVDGGGSVSRRHDA